MQSHLGLEETPIERLTYDGCVGKYFASMAKVVQVVEPTRFEEVDENNKWQEVMNEEMDALYGNETWELVPLPKGKMLIGCRWVYKVKHNSDGSVSTYKVRIVAKGYAQTYGIDYDETFSLVTKMATIRVVITAAAAKGSILHRMDVKDAFLHDDLRDEVYMEQPLDEENKIEDEGDMSQETQQVLPTIDEETPFHKGDAMSTQEVVEHESDFVAQKPSNDMNKGSENMLPTIEETQIHEGNTRNSEEKMVLVENQSDVQTSPKPSDDMII
ncbi:hypothetical protein L7F22_057133 [Adiantum nelumboides]|nr:hypothetical protein [Adiantum nelumboides]